MKNMKKDLEASMDRRRTPVGKTLKPASDGARAQFIVYMDPEDRKRLKRLAVEDGRSMSQIVNQLITDYLDQEGY